MKFLYVKDILLHNGSFQKCDFNEESMQFSRILLVNVETYDGGQWSETNFYEIKNKYL